ncbi:MAG: family 16 glycosylhydrolase [Lentisphaerae bacterium]|nr:family 16 glycosylhydrolase [Lentisphaerota bacterium]
MTPEPASLIPQPVAAREPLWVPRNEFSDEFDGMRLDLQKWDSGVASWGRWSWEPENAWTEKGCLKLGIQYKEHVRDGKKLFYTSGIIRSKAPPICYGYFEARLKTAPLYPGVSPAFWLYRNEPNIWTEIDFELSQGSNIREIQANTFVFRHPAFPDQPIASNPRISEVHPWQAPGDTRSDFHIYGLEWNAQELKWHVDGNLIRTRENTFWHQALDLVVSLGLRNPYATKPSPTGFPTAFEVDYVRTWKSSCNWQGAVLLY